MSADAMPTPAERAVMTMLMSRGHYQETPDDLEWLRHDAKRAVDAAPHGAEAVRAAFIDTALHGEDDDSACLAEDARLVMELAT